MLSIRKKKCGVCRTEIKSLVLIVVVENKVTLTHPWLTKDLIIRSKILGS